VVAAAVLGLSYCEEQPKYHFERVARDVGNQLPGTRVIGTTSTSDLASPMSLIRPAKTAWRYAMPHPTILGFFYLMTLDYDTKRPATVLMDTDCTDSTALVSSVEGKGVPALDLFGRPIVAPGGRVFRHIGDAQKLTPEEHVAFCKWNWDKERAEVARAVLENLQGQR
jgi:hypothetical protein